MILFFSFSSPFFPNFLGEERSVLRIIFDAHQALSLIFSNNSSIIILFNKPGGLLITLLLIDIIEIFTNLLRFKKIYNQNFLYILF